METKKQIKAQLRNQIAKEYKDRLLSASQECRKARMELCAEQTLRVQAEEKVASLQEEVDMYKDWVRRLQEFMDMDPETREFDFEDGSLTENTRVGYPINYINNAQIPSKGGIPKVVIFLTADAFGVLPPISRLDKNAAMYHFVTGFTSKLAGTERGVTEPQPTFSTLFGEPFMPMDASVYAKMLGDKLEKYGTKVYLVNTGWAGGSASSGAKRMKLAYTRAMVTAALNGSFDNVAFKHHDVFNVDYPTSCPNVPDEKLDARGMWEDKAAYDEQANKLAQMFADNFAEKYPNMPSEIVAAGPKPLSRV